MENVGWDNIEQEVAVLKEWEHVQHALLGFALLSPRSIVSRQAMIEECITRSTKDHAKIWWDASLIKPTDEARLYDVCYQHIRYGVIELTPAYLVSKLLPHLPQSFVRLCALIMTLVEHEEVIDHLAQLPNFQRITPLKPLSLREKDVLHGLIYGESEMVMAKRLHIEPATVHTHLQRLYAHLNVHTAQEAVVRSFTARLINWLDLTE